jgi:hypothetical protein
MARIYLASSWRNAYRPALFMTLRNAGHGVYDFWHSTRGIEEFAWRDCGGTRAATIPSYLEAIRSQRAAQMVYLIKEALAWCDTCVLLQPSDRSAHLEAGWAAGRGKRVAVRLHEDGVEPELMYLFCGADGIVSSDEALLDYLAAAR